MALTMRPIGLGSGIDKDRADYTVFCGEWNIGRIYEVRGGPDHLRWFWALHFPSKPESLHTDNRVATLEATKVLTRCREGSVSTGSRPEPNPIDS
jgi:hypothetical protein